MLGAHLHDPVVFLYGITRCLGLDENVSHRLFNISVFVRFRGQLQNGRVRMLWGGNNDRINIRQCEDIFQILKWAGRTAVVASILFDGPVTVYAPQIADSRHFYVVSGLVLSNYPIQFLPTTPRANVGERNSIVSPENPGVRNRLWDDSGPNQRR
jgi:hypothetical protein